MASPTDLSPTQQRVSDLIHKTAGGPPAARREALEQITGIVMENGEFTPDSLEATPLLVAAAGAPEPVEKGPLFTLLADLSVGREHEASLISGYDVQSPQLAGLDPEHPLRIVHEAVAAGAPAYVAGLESPDAETRAAAALVLAFLSAEAGASLGPVRARLAPGAEADERARASAVLCLGYLARYRSLRAEAEHLARLHDESEGLVRFGAAAALIQAGTAPLGEGPRRTLIDALSRSPAVVDGFPWAHGNVPLFASLALSCAAVEARDPGLLLGVLDAAEKLPTYRDVANALVDAAFAGHDSTPRIASSLTPAQREALEAIVDRRLTPRVFFALAAHGVPPHHAALQRYLGKSPAGPLDREVDGEPLWLAGVAAARGDSAAADRWIAAVTAGGDAEAVIAAASDALADPYAVARLLPQPARDTLEVERRRWVRVEQMAARALAKTLSPARLDALRDELRDKTRTPLAAAAAFAAADHAASRGEIIDTSWDAILAGAASEDASPELRRILAALPDARREAVISAVPFTCEVEEGPEDEPEIHAGGAWALADLCPTEAMADRVVSALLDQDPEDCPPPADRALEILSATGEAGKRALTAALDRADDDQRELIEDLLGSLD